MGFYIKERVFIMVFSGIAIQRSGNVLKRSKTKQDTFDTLIRCKNVYTDSDNTLKTVNSDYEAFPITLFKKGMAYNFYLQV